MKYFYHIAKKNDWVEASRNGSYSVSTLGKTLNEVGFIHFSFAHQVKMVADFIYKDTPYLILLKINPSKLKPEVKIEAVDGTDEKFPHLFGPLNVDAVESVQELKLSPDGSFPNIEG
jgi:glutathione S-transferase